MRFYTTDEGISSPHFLRYSMYSVPTTGRFVSAIHSLVLQVSFVLFSTSISLTRIVCSLVNQSCIPFGAVLSPFAEDIYPEDRPEVVTDLKEKGPPRCIRCKSYPSPNWVWIDGGKAFRYVTGETFVVRSSLDFVVL